MRYLFFRRDGQDIGLALSVVYASEDGKQFILEFCVFPEFRGNGTGAACAGALGLQLGGTHLYFGKPVVKPTIGDAVRPICRRDVKRANDLALLTALLALLLFDVLPLVIWRIWL